MKSLAGLAIILVGVLGSSCGRQDTIYSDGGDQIVAIEHSSLPDGFYDQSVNHADAMVANSSLRLRVRGGVAEPGSYNDSSLTGSRATVGIAGLDSTLLSDFSLHVDSTSTTTDSIRVSLLVDLKCDDVNVRTLESTIAVGSSDLSTDWTVNGSPLSDALGTVLLSSSPSPLSALLNEYPKACLKSGLSGAPDAISLIPVSGVQLSIGSGTSMRPEEVSISSLVLNGETHSSWSVP